MNQEPSYQSITVLLTPMEIEVLLSQIKPEEFSIEVLRETADQLLKRIMNKKAMALGRVS